MPALRERLEHIRQLGSLDGSDLPDGASLTIEGRCALCLAAPLSIP